MSGDANDLLKQTFGPHKTLFDNILKGASTTTSASTFGAGPPLTAESLKETVDKFVAQDMKYRDEMDRLLQRQTGQYSLITPEGDFIQGTPQRIVGYLYQQIMRFRSQVPPLTGE